MRAGTQAVLRLPCETWHGMQHKRSVTARPALGLRRGRHALRHRRSRHVSEKHAARAAAEPDGRCAPAANARTAIKASQQRDRLSLAVLWLNHRG